MSQTLEVEPPSDPGPEEPRWGGGGVEIGSYPPPVMAHFNRKNEELEFAKSKSMSPVPGTCGGCRKPGPLLII